MAMLNFWKFAKAVSLLISLLLGRETMLTIINDEVKQKNVHQNN
jgi:hypothetical protein